MRGRPEQKRAGKSEWPNSSRGGFPADRQADEGRASSGARRVTVVGVDKEPSLPVVSISPLSRWNGCRELSETGDWRWPSSLKDTHELSQPLDLASARLGTAGQRAGLESSSSPHHGKPQSSSGRREGVPEAGNRYSTPHMRHGAFDSPGSRAWRLGGHQGAARRWLREREGRHQSFAHEDKLSMRGAGRSGNDKEREDGESISTA